MICVGENSRKKSCLKTFRFSGKFVEIRAKIFRTPKNSPAPTPVPSTLLLLPCPTAVSVFGIHGNYGKMFVVVRYLVHEAGVKVKLIELKSCQVKLLQYLVKIIHTPRKILTTFV